MDVVQILVVVFFGILFAVLIFGAIIEPLYVLIFNKPIYIHWYPFALKLSDSQRNILEKEFVFYRKLSDQRKRFFECRVAAFIEKYKFIGQADFVVTDQVKVLISATFVMLTFGMRYYLIRVFDKIIIYPEAYFSTINKEFHKGEFNPGLKTVVFSWKDFEEGFRYESDNINLGLHEFAHALYFHGLKGKDQSSIVFADAYVKIQEYLVRSNVLDHLIASKYFRIYAYTNQVEFFAVVLEHFFETPQIFKKEFPELYNDIREMINFDEEDLK
ncbi:zinc-dependent peptidase [Flavobacterium sp. W1B]|uniref:zinc-dependent peptidase n=1 Tax=Flavobacterium sp. W1B TaxID=3394146 RepID=UPI0039BC55C2